MKAKKGQTLIMVLVIMTGGMIAIMPLLHYLDTTYSVYKYTDNRARAYYAADSMIGVIMQDMVAGQNISANAAKYTNYTAGGWLNGYNVSTSIKTSIAYPTYAKQSTDTDFTITTNASRNGHTVVTITAGIRQSNIADDNFVTIFSWDVK